MWSAGLGDAAKPCLPSGRVSFVDRAVNTDDEAGVTRTLDAGYRLNQGEGHARTVGSCRNTGRCAARTRFGARAAKTRARSANVHIAEFRRLGEEPRTRGGAYGSRDAYACEGSGTTPTLTPEELRRLRESMPDLITDQFETIGAAADGCDVILGANAHQYAAPSIAEHEGIGCVTAVYAPVALPSPDLPPPPTPGQAAEAATPASIEERRPKGSSSTWSSSKSRRYCTTGSRNCSGGLAAGKSRWRSSNGKGPSSTRS